MRVHYLRHAPRHDTATIEAWAQARGHVVSGTHVYESAGFPTLADFDVLVIMGGGVNVYQYDANPWLRPEKALIRSAIDTGKAVLGICLGGQLMADVLGAPVTRAANTEVGWFPVWRTERGRDVPVFADFPPEFTTFCAHHDTFAIPKSATHVASSAACDNQAFVYGDGRVVGLQFHPEVTRIYMEAQIDSAKAGPPPFEDGPWVRPPENFLAPDAPFETCNGLLCALLDRMVALIE